MSRRIPTTITLVTAGPEDRRIPVRIRQTAPGLVEAEIREDGTTGDWMVIGTATLFRRTEGASFSGWVVRAGRAATDPIRDRDIALWHLCQAVEERQGGVLLYGRAGQRLSDLFAPGGVR